MTCCPNCGYDLEKRSADMYYHSYLVFDPANLLTTWRGKPVNLTAQEHAFLDALVEQLKTGRFFSKDALLARLSGHDCAGNLLQVIAFKVRKKFRQIDPLFDSIRNKHGTGYYWAFESIHQLGKQSSPQAGVGGAEMTSDDLEPVMEEGDGQNDYNIY